MFTSPWVVALSAIFVWWFSTGILLWRVRHADNRGPESHMISVIIGLPLLFAGVWGYSHTLADLSVKGVYVAFLSALAIWGWIELAFLSGVITGPNTGPCPAHARPVERFLRAVGTVLWHEIVLLTVLVAMTMHAVGTPNRFGLWTFMILFIARISAKLNLYLGVPYINVEFLPSTLSHLPSYFRRTRMNNFFPLSITLLTFATGCWVERALSADGSNHRAVGFWLLAALTALAVLEHWFMVMNLQDKKLWKWMMPEPRIPVGPYHPASHPAPRNAAEPARAPEVKLLNKKANGL
ncbi:putative photosynthetic complex assembly protein 2 [Cereibacter ovatus]|uniref:Putative photosynthetic complex assembly protein 2 n=1 Tax=Cereibacter ovatus TaxID=439529 RepID=A0A285CY80_9RHOB|nr:putative photosynthetic complex assembly protein PuhE [Cereibacter ovatus]SNX72018.1 putative photosynthetic complex assembly protein 2 [Cereibacter ovatus]